MKKEVILGEKTRKVVGEPIGVFSHGIKARPRNFIFLSGQGAFVQGKLIGKGDLAVQYRQALESIKAILADAGASMDDVVKMVVYVGVDITPDSKEYAAISEIRKEYFKDIPPVSTLIKVAGFLIKDMLIEVDATAIVD